MNTIEEKARAYDEALERARKLNEDPQGIFYMYSHKEGYTICDYIFPELKESEDEKIRKWIINEIKINHHNLDEDNVDFVDKAITWLEKQGEKLVKDIESDKAEKFKVGDWIINRTGATIMQIVNNEDFYESVEIGGQRRTDTYNYVEWDFRLWSIEDAKDGDILANDNSIFIFQEEYIAEKPIAYCGLMNGLFIKGENTCWSNKNVKPATKEQREQLEKAMADAGYIFDFEEKKLKGLEKIEIPLSAKDSELQETTYFIPKGFHAEIDADKVVIKKGKQNPTDEEMIEALRTEYEKGRADAIAEMQVAWKPSDEQMDALEQFISEYKDIDDNSRAYPISYNIESLYNDLKKLKV